MRAVGEASNAGAGGDEALRQACALAQRGGSYALNALVDGDDYEPVANEGYLSGVRSKIFLQGRSQLEAALSSACLALAGQSDGMASGFLDPETMKRMGIALALDESEALLRDLAAPYVTRFEIETGYDDGAFTWQALTVVPLWKDEAGRDHLFTQLSMSRHTRDGDTYNLGVAWRRLNEAKTMVWGLNSFFDHAGRHNHNRMSVGADVQTSQLGLSANRYFPVSDWKNLDDYWEERAASGWDLELQGRLPELPSWEASLRGYRWSSNDEGLSEDVFGYDAALRWTPVNIVQVEAGVRDEQDSDPELHATLRLTYRFGDAVGPAFDKPLRLASVEERVYDKVRRENRVRTERRVRDTAYVSVIETVGANSATTEFGSVALSPGQELPRPFTVIVSAAGGSVARLRFRDGAILTVGAGSRVRVEATRITLIAGQFQYVSGSTNIIINVPGGTVTLHGTDVDVSTDGTSSVLRVRDGGATLAGTASGSATLAPGEAAETTNGNVANLPASDPAYIAHADTISMTIDRAASPQTGAKIAPYNTEAPRLTATATTPGQTITIGLKFNTAITAAGGPPRLTLDIGGNTRNAVLAAGSGSDDLAFDYTLQPGDGGATSITVQALDLNGATLTGNNGKTAVATIADTVLDLMGSIDDVTAPSGYAVAFTTDPVDGDNEATVAFQITGAEVGAVYDYSITSSGGGTPVTGSGTIATATQTISGIDVSTLADGTLTLSLTLTDASSNTGAPATDTVTKDVIYLALNFVGGAYELGETTYGSPAAIPGWSFTRAAPAITYAENEDGTLTAFAANQPRITDRGLLIEGSRTNLIPRSQEMDNGAWSSVGVNIIPDATVAPDGTLTADRMVVLSSTDLKRVSQTLDVATGAQYVQSIYVKPDEVTTFVFRNSASNRVVFDLASKQINGILGIYTDARIKEVGAGWLRLEAQFTAPTDTFLYFAGIATSNSTGNGTDGLYMWGAQLEQGSFASSYIPTTNAAVTRSADSADVAGLTNFDQATLYAAGEFLNRPAAGYVQALVTAGPGTDNGWLARVGHNSAGHFRVDTQDASNTNAANMNTGVADLNSVQKSASRIAADNFAVSRNGAAVVKDLAGATRTVNQIQVGKAGPSYPLDGYVRDIRIYPSAKSDAELQMLTSP